MGSTRGLTGDAVLVDMNVVVINLGRRYQITVLDVRGNN